MPQNSVAWIGLLGLGIAAMAPAARSQCATQNEPLTARPRLFSPIELGQGGMWINGGAPDTYGAALRWHALTVGIDARSRLRLGGTVGLQYFNPDLQFVAGGQLSWRPPFLQLFELGGSAVAGSVAAEALAGTEGRGTLGGAFTVSAFSLLEANVRVGRELRDDHTFFEVSLGTDIAAWLRGPARRSGGPPPSPFADLSGFLRLMAVTANTRVNALCAPGHEAALALARDATLLRDAQAQTSPDALLAFLRGRGAGELADLLDRSLSNALADARDPREGIIVPDLSVPGNRQLVVNAMIRGWRIAVERS